MEILHELQILDLIVEMDLCCMQHLQEHHSHWLGCLSSLHSTGEFLPLRSGWKTSLLRKYFWECCKCYWDSCRFSSKCGTSYPFPSFWMGFANNDSEGCQWTGCGWGSLMDRYQFFRIVNNRLPFNISSSLPSLYPWFYYGFFCLKLLVTST